jgi:hypothetical protein
MGALRFKMHGRYKKEFVLQVKCNDQQQSVTENIASWLEKIVTSIRPQFTEQ